MSPSLTMNISPGPLKSTTVTKRTYVRNEVRNLPVESRFFRLKKLDRTAITELKYELSPDTRFDQNPTVWDDLDWLNEDNEDYNWRWYCDDYRD